MRILIATPVFPPDIGGPALYAKNLMQKFEKQGHLVKVAVFSNVRFLPGVRHFLFLIRSLARVYWAERVFSLDHFSVGFPIAILCFIFRKKLYIRVGGDFLWERFVEKNRVEISLPDFYRVKPRLSLINKFVKFCMVFTFKQAKKIIFSSSWQRSFFIEPYRIPVSKTAVIENYFVKKEPVEKRTHEFIWAGRMIFLKNLGRLIDAFVEFLVRHPEGGFTLHLIGEGPERKNLESRILNLESGKKTKIENALDQDALQRRLKSAYAFVLPSFSEVTPNASLDAISFSVPFIATRYTSYYDKFKEFGLFVDPFDKTALVNAFLHMASTRSYDVYKRSLLEFSLARDWDEIAQEYVILFTL